LEYRIIDPSAFPSWNDLLATCRRHSFFHTAEWSQVLSEAYGYRPLYFVSFRNNAICSLAPLMEVRSLLTGKRAVSLPFTDECPLVFRDRFGFAAYLKSLQDLGKQRGWRYIEWRGGDRYFQGKTPFCRFFIHTLKLRSDEGRMLSGFRSSTRRNIRKAEKSGVTVEIADTLEAVSAFCRLNRMTRKVHGLPPQPFRFFRLLHRHVVSRKRGFVALASFQGKPVAASVYLHFGRRAIYKYGASDRRFQHLRANNLVMWEAIRWYTAQGFESFSFGRTAPHNTGLLQFKRGWGVEETSLQYYRFDLERDAFVQERKKHEFLFEVFNRMPEPMLRLMGMILYRHVA